MVTNHFRKTILYHFITFMGSVQFYKSHYIVLVSLADTAVTHSMGVGILWTKPGVPVSILGARMRTVPGKILGYFLKKWDSSLLWLTSKYPLSFISWRQRFMLYRHVCMIGNNCFVWKRWNMEVFVNLRNVRHFILIYADPKPQICLF